MAEVSSKHNLPTIIDEIGFWQNKLRLLQSITDQLKSSIGSDILHNLFQAQSVYAHSFSGVQEEMEGHFYFVTENLTLLQTIQRWILELNSCENVDRLMKLAAPTMHVLLLIWQNSPYYHAHERLNHLLTLISNHVVIRARCIVGQEVLKDPVTSHLKLSSALRVCAAWRGKYLDERDRAQEINQRNILQRKDEYVFKPSISDGLFTTKMYGPHAYKPNLRGSRGRTYC